MSFVPKYILSLIDYKKGEIVKSEDYNGILNLLVAASDNNTKALEQLFFDEEIKWVLNAINADDAKHALKADDSDALSGATLVRSNTGTLSDSDNIIPSSKVVKAYIDSYINTSSENFSNISKLLNSITNKNVEQDNRLANIDGALMLNNNKITLLENRLNTTNNEINAIKNTDLAQDATISNHNKRILALEAGEIPSDIIDTLMSIQNYALYLGLSPTGEQQYSTNIVAQANTAFNLSIDGSPIPANSFARNEVLDRLNSASFITRGVLADPIGEAYTVGELKNLMHGSYEVSNTNALKLLNIDNAGTLRSYPCTNGVSLEFEIQTGPQTGSFSTLFITTSTPDNTLITSLDWYNAKDVHDTLANEITALDTNKLAVNALLAGTDIAITKAENICTVNYTGPKIVISEEQPDPDPERVTLWIAL